MSAPVDVLAVIDAELRTARGLASSDAYYAHSLPKLEAARDAVAELIAASVEWNEALQDFANDGRPENWVRYQAAEPRFQAALARCQP